MADDLGVIVNCPKCYRIKWSWASCSHCEAQKLRVHDDNYPPCRENASVSMKGDIRTWLPPQT